MARFRIGLALLSVSSCCWANSDFVFSNDSFSVSPSANTRQLTGSPGSTHKLEFILRNNGNPGNFFIRQEGNVSGRLTRSSVYLRSDEMILITAEDIYLPNNRGEWLQFVLTVDREAAGRAKRSPQGGFNSGSSSGGSGSGGFNSGGSGGFNSGGSGGFNSGGSGGFNSGGSGSGGFNNGGSGSGGFNTGGSGGNGGFNSGGSGSGNNGGFNGGQSGGGGRPDINGGNNGGFNSGGRPDAGDSNNGGYNGGNSGGRPDIGGGGNNGGYNGGNAGGRPDIGGGNNNGGYNGGGYNNGGNTGGRPDIGGGSGSNGGYNGGGYNGGGYNGGGYNSGGRGRPSINDPWLHGSSSRPDYNQTPGGRTQLRTSVLFHVTSQYVPPDTIAPEVRTEMSDSGACTAAKHCSEQEWSVRFAVQDNEQGLFAMRLTAVGEGSGPRLFWWRENHVVGSLDPVRMGAVISCCTLGVALEVEDMAANQEHVSVAQSGVGMNWRIVIGVSVGVGVLVIILVGVFGTCLYRKKYHGVPQDGL